MTQEQSTQMNCLISTFLSADFLVRIFHNPEGVLGSTAAEELCSLSLPDFLKPKSLRFFSLKTCRQSCHLITTKCLKPSSMKFQNWGIVVNGNVLTGEIISPRAESECSLRDILIPDVRGKIAAAVAELTSHRTQGERVYDSGGSAVTQTATGGGFGGKTGMYFIDMNADAKMTDVARCITTRQDSGIGKHKGEKSGVFVEYDGVYPVINPDRETVRQNGPRIRPNGAPAFCLTVVDRHGVIHHGRVRRLVPQECFRLMGFEDSQFFKLQNKLHLSDAKLYKLAGNSIIVPILADIMTNIKQVNEKICNYMLIWKFWINLEINVSCFELFLDRFNINSLAAKDFDRGVLNHFLSF